MVNPCSDYGQVRQNLCVENFSNSVYLCDMSIFTVFNVIMCSSDLMVFKRLLNYSEGYSSGLDFVLPDHQCHQYFS